MTKKRKNESVGVESHFNVKDNYGTVELEYETPLKPRILRPEEEKKFYPEKTENEKLSETIHKMGRQIDHDRHLLRDLLTVNDKLTEIIDTYVSINQLIAHGMKKNKEQEEKVKNA
jgi:hypothetical protein